MYRARSVLVGDLADAWAVFVGLLEQCNIILLVTDMSITDRPGISIAYGRRIRRRLQKLAQKMRRCGLFRYPDRRTPGYKGWIHARLRVYRRIDEEGEGGREGQEGECARAKRRIRRATNANSGPRAIVRRGGRPGAQTRRLPNRAPRKMRRRTRRPRRKRSNHMWAERIGNNSARTLSNPHTPPGNIDLATMEVRADPPPQAPFIPYPPFLVQIFVGRLRLI